MLRHHHIIDGAVCNAEGLERLARWLGVPAGQRTVLGLDKRLCELERDDQAAERIAAERAADEAAGAIRGAA